MAELSSLQRWLHYVDEQLSPEAVDFLKLGLHSEFFHFYSETQKLDKPSLIYYFLLDRCMKQSSAKALKMFLHVVRGLGSRLRGTAVVSEGFASSSTYNVKDPGLFDIKKASANFKFFQCLLQISVKARNMALGDQLKKKFCKRRLLNMNHRHINNLPELFILLYQRQIIAYNNTHHLVEALNKYSARVCLQILNSYHKSVGLQPIALAEGNLSDLSSSEPATSMDDSDYPEDHKQHRVALYTLDDTEAERLNYVSSFHVQNPPPNEGENDSDADSETCIIESSESERILAERRRDAAKGQLGANKVIIMSDYEARRKSRRGYKICTIILTGLMILSVISLICLVLKVWIKLAPHHESSLILDGSTILLAEDGVDSLFHEQVDISIHNISTKNPDTNIQFFGVPGNCKHLGNDLSYNGKPEKFHLTEQNISNLVPVYVLKGSTFDFVITSNINDSRSVNVWMYSGTKYSVAKHKEVLLREGSGQFTVESPGYVYFNVTPKENSQYSLLINATMKMLQGDGDRNLGCSINTTNYKCSIPLPLKSRFCLVAKFYDTLNSVSNIELMVDVSKSRFGVIFVPSLLFLVIILAIIILSILVCCCRLHSSRSSTVTIV